MSSTDTHLWSETYERKIEDVFRRSGRNRPRDRGGARRRAVDLGRVARRPTKNMEAYRLYLKAREL